jgi:hypothetical protein
MNQQPRQTTFEWPARERSSWLLAGLIFAMLLLHSAAFFLFQAAAPAINPPPRTAPAVQLLTPYTPNGQLSSENQFLLRWVEAEDPALVARVPGVSLPTSLQAPVPYRPSYATMRTPPLGAPVEPVSVLFPPARDALSIIRSGTPQDQPIAREIAPRNTQLTFSPNLAKRVSTPIQFSPQTRTDKLIEPTEFLIGVSETGETRFVFLQKRESGNIPALNEEARSFVTALQFQPAPGTNITWGNLTIHWGDELAAKP